MAILKKPAKISIPITLALTTAALYQIWKMDTMWMAASLAKGLLVSADIILIVFSAVFLVMVLRKTHIFFVIVYLLNKVSEDKRIQAIIVGWFFVGFIEGVAGFGTPAMLAAPILISLGFPKITSVAVALIGNSVTVMFGAVGMPVIVGLTQGLESANPALVISAFQGSALIHLALGWIIPLVIACIPVFIYRRSIKKGLAIWKYAITAGFCYMIPFYAAAYFLGPEFPTIIGALVGGAVLIYLTKLGVAVPKEPWKMIGENTSNVEFVIKDTDREFLSPAYMTKIFAPYAVIILGLLLSRINFLGFGDVAQAASLQLSNIFGTSIEHTVNIIYSPGFFIALSAVIPILIFKIKGKEILHAVRETSAKLTSPIIGITAALAMMQMLIYSGANSLELPSIPIYLAEMASGVTWIWPLASPFIGAIGAFMAGSATVSNLMFSELQFQTASLVGAAPVLMLALQLAGSSVGNMISLQNIISASAVVGLKNKEGELLRITLPVMILYLVLAAVLGYFIL